MRGDRGAGALDGDQRLLLVGLGHEQRELVAAQAGEDVLGAGDVAQRGGDGGQHDVAALVAERVVDRLEVVDVEQRERERPLVAQRAGELLAQALVEGAVVGQARERIGGRLLDEDRVGLGVGHGQADELGEVVEHALGVGRQRVGRHGGHGRSRPTAVRARARASSASSRSPCARRAWPPRGGRRARRAPRGRCGAGRRRA